MSEKLVLEALQKNVTAAVLASTLPSLKVKYIGIPYKPAANTPWLELVNIPNNVSAEFWNSGKTYRGLFRLLLHWPIDSKGIYDAMNLLTSIGQSFEKGKRIQNGSIIVMVTDHPDMPTILEQESDTICVLSVRYNCFVE